MEPAHAATAERTDAATASANSGTAGIWQDKGGVFHALQGAIQSVWGLCPQAVYGKAVPWKGSRMGIAVQFGGDHNPEGASQPGLGSQVCLLQPPEACCHGQGLASTMGQQPIGTHSGRGKTDRIATSFQACCKQLWKVWGFPRQQRFGSAGNQHAEPGTSGPSIFPPGAELGRTPRLSFSSVDVESRGEFLLTARE